MRRCLESIAQHPPSLRYEIVVVDNASTDGSREWLESLGATVHLIKNKENAGFGRANNRGFAATDAPLLFLLNNDAEVQAGSIDRLVETIESDPRIGGCGPRIVNPDGSLQVSVWRNPPMPWEMILTGLRLSYLLPKRVRGELLLGPHWDHARRRRVNMLVGAAILVRREVIDQVGGFDERFHMYAEDGEWCLRIVRAGWRLIFEPDAIVMHHGGQSTKQRWEELDRLRVLYEASFRFQKLCLSPVHRIANLATACLLIPAQLMWRKLERRPTADVTLTWKLHLAELKRALRSDAP